MKSSGDGGFEWSEVDQYVIKRYLQFLGNKGYKKPNSAVARGRKLAAIKSFFKYLCSEAKIKTDPATMVKMPKT
ncbi:MAG: site-specific integrase, partial [Candidatus Omnitrophica bacterium]|nr:site-specific integrase [Candidatus Omnitrophota bacterium]